MPRIPNRNLAPTGTPNTAVQPLAARIRHFEQLRGRVIPIPQEWFKRAARASNDVPYHEGGNLKCTPCSRYRELVRCWRRAIKWTDGLDCALSVMLASAASTQLVGEQLWCKIIGPPASGKTTILEGLSVSKRYVCSKDTVRGFYTGFRTNDGSDNSIAALAQGKTLATKDGDTLLKAPNLGQILSEARGLYDRVGRTHYRNAVMNDYEGHRMTWLLCGTAALREIDESELGSRFLDCVVMDAIDDEFEDDVAWRAVNQEAVGMLAESNGDPDSRHPPDLAAAMKLTGGYLEYLRENIVGLLPGIVATAEQKQQCARLAKWVAYMRARPSRNQKRDDSECAREFSARLAKQHIRLANCLAVVLNRNSLDREVMRRTRKVAMDTSRGFTLDVVQLLYPNPAGLEPRALGTFVNRTDDHTRKMLRFLQRIGVVERYSPPYFGSYSPETMPGRYGTPRWRLTDQLRRLYEVVREDA